MLQTHELCETRICHRLISGVPSRFPYRSGQLMAEDNSIFLKAVLLLSLCRRCCIDRDVYTCTLSWFEIDYAGKGASSSNILYKKTFLCILSLCYVLEIYWPYLWLYTVTRRSFWKWKWIEMHSNAICRCTCIISATTNMRIWKMYSRSKLQHTCTCYIVCGWRHTVTGDLRSKCILSYTWSQIGPAITRCILFPLVELKQNMAVAYLRLLHLCSREITLFWAPFSILPLWREAVQNGCYFW